MLVLSRKDSERIHIGDSIVVTVVKIQGGVVRLGIEAPPELPIAREELLRRSNEAQRRGPPECHEDLHARIIQGFIARTGGSVGIFQGHVPVRIAQETRPRSNAD